MLKNTAQHILPTSANLLGFCLFIITSVHLNNQSQVSFIDNIASVIALLLSVSCVLSFVSIRTENMNKSNTLESMADYFFLVSLGGVLVVTLFLSVSIL